MVFIGIKENNDVVDKSVIVVTMLFQCFVYKMLYIQKRIRIIYKINIRTLYSSLIDEGKMVLIVGMYYKLEKEVCYINDYKIFFSLNYIDNLLLQR